MSNVERALILCNLDHEGELECESDKKLKNTAISTL
jgi:hypothetical protein